MLWEVATAGHQVEGNSSDDWSIFESDPEIRRKVAVNALGGHVAMTTAPAGIALRHRDLGELARDLDRARALGATAYRFSVEWSRVEPSMGVFSDALSTYYAPAVRMMRERGLEPFVTLNHLTLPQWVLTPPRRHDPFEAWGMVWADRNDPGFRSSLMGWENPVTVTRFLMYVDTVGSGPGPGGRAPLVHPE